MLLPVLPSEASELDEKAEASELVDRPERFMVVLVVSRAQQFASKNVGAF